MTIKLDDSDFRKYWDITDPSALRQTNLPKELFYKANLVYYEGRKGKVIFKARHGTHGVVYENKLLVPSKTHIQNFL